MYHTLKYLKLKQFLWRIIFYLPRFIRPQHKCPSPKSISFENAIFLTKKTITFDYDNFIFLNETHSLNQIGWNSKSVSKLWMYNLHYFDYLTQNFGEEDFPTRRKLILDWLAKNPLGEGTGWEPYPTSIRIINWVKHSFMGYQLPPEAILSLWNQARWLQNRPEYHLLGNHLFVNAKALLFATAFFGLDDNSRFYKTALKIFEAELDEQFLDDGGHFELSPMYHTLGMEDLLDVLNIVTHLPSSFPKQKLQSKLERGMLWLEAFTYENDELAHFNDCANGIAPSPTTLKEYYSLILSKECYYKETLSPTTYFRQSGFVVHKDKDWHLIADIGIVGPDYLPGHAHADTLSFELAAKGIRVIVNSGTSIYGTSKERLRQRSTAAHSTIEIAGRSSSEVWSGFRVARRAVPFDISFQNTDGLFFGASQNGYLKQGFKSIHRRTWKYINGGWEISDFVEGGNEKAIARFFIHPSLCVIQDLEGFIFTFNNQPICRMSTNQMGATIIVDASYHDEFGVSKPNKCLEVHLTSEHLTTKWQLL